MKQYEELEPHRVCFPLSNADANNNNSGSLDLISKTEDYLIVIDSADATDTATLSGTFDTNLTAIFPQWQRAITTNDDMDEAHFMHELTDENTATITRDQAANIYSVAGTAVEFGDKVVKKVHRGTVTVTASSTTATSSTFDATLANCAVLEMGSQCTEIADTYTDGYARIALSGSDGAVSVTATCDGSSSDTVTVSFAIIEFFDGMTDSIQEVSITISEGATSANASISSVDTDRCLTLFGGRSTTETTTDYDAVMCRIGITGAATVSAARGAGSEAGQTVTTNATVVELASKVVFGDIERHVNEIITNGVSTEDITIDTPLTDLTKAFISHLGWQFTSNFADLNPSSQFATLDILDVNNVRLERETNSGVTYRTSYETIQG